MHAVTRYRPQANKVTRMHAQTAVPGLNPGNENGFLHLPQAAPWLAEYLHELALFPNGRHDDQVELDRTVPPTGSRCRAARTASTLITGCAPRNCAASKARPRPDRARPRTLMSRILMSRHQKMMHLRCSYHANDAHAR